MLSQTYAVLPNNARINLRASCSDAVTIRLPEVLGRYLGSQRVIAVRPFLAMAVNSLVNSVLNVNFAGCG